MAQADAVGATTEISYDIGNRRVVIFTPESKTKGKPSQQDTYNALDSVTQTIDGEGNKTSYILDKWGRIIKVAKANGSVEIYDYDCAGNITATTDGNGNTIKYVYNSVNKLGKIIDQEGLEEILKCDKQGRLAYKKDRNGNEIRYAFNMDDKITYRRNAADLSDTSSLETYAYNADGTLKEAVANGIRYIYTYDKMGRQLEKKENSALLLRYFYDRNGNLVGQQDISGKFTKYILDVAGRIEHVLDDERAVASYEYNEDGTIACLAYANGIKTFYEYDWNKNITKLTTLFSNGSVLTENEYSYDNNGNQVQKTENGVATTYQYDPIHQIQEVVYKKNTDRQKVEAFVYDAAGNRVERKVDNQKEAYYYDNKNRLIELQSQLQGMTSFEYDNQGNTLREVSSAGTKEYGYDIYNRTVGVETDDGHSIRNVYDPIGLRAKKVTDSNESRYVFSGWNIVAELDSEFNVKAREVRGYGLLEKDADEQKYYYHHNEHGDVTALTSGEEKTLNSYEYDVFGNGIASSEGIENHFRYAGEQFDCETGQYYLRARFYNPSIGKFTQEDIYRNDGLNLYSYVKNNPIMWIDPSGLKKCGKGEVEITPKEGSTPEQKAQYEAYVNEVNALISQGYEFEKVSTAGQLREDASRAARTERERAENAGTPYTGAVGHVPDTCWSGTPTPPSWMDLDRSVNSSLGGQSNAYEVGYEVTKFVYKDN